MTSAPSPGSRSLPARGRAGGSRRAVFALEVAEALARGAPHEKPPRLEELGRGVYRVRGYPGTTASVIAKRLSVSRADREGFVLAEWLPALGLAGLGPSLVDRFEGEGHAVLVYEDLGHRTVEALGRVPADDRPRDRGFLSPLTGSPGREVVEAGARTLARLHGASREQALLSSIRGRVPDLGASGHARRVEAVAASVRRLRNGRSPGVDPAGRGAEVVARLDEWSKRAREGSRRQTGAGSNDGESVFLHGDAGVRNVMIVEAPGGTACRLIDWDHCGVGPAAYDLSTYVLQLAPSDRQSAVAAYEESRPEERRPARAWADLFRACEETRLTSALAGAAADAAAGAAWAYEEVDKVLGWFEALSGAALLETEGEP